jgi:hypothetical protein
MPELGLRNLRAATAGAAAAAVWAAQQPLDKRVFGCAYDDVEMLGKLLTRGPSYRVAGWALHIINGAIFGVLYARVVRPRSPLPGAATGMLAAIAENTVLWPATELHDRWHPARPGLPALAGNPRAFAQATWRHALFGVILGAATG